MGKNTCLDCGSEDIISPRRCRLDSGAGLSTYCPKCKGNIVSFEFYIVHSLEEDQKDFPVYICPGCNSHMHHVAMTKEEYTQINEAAELIINEILKDEQAKKA